tara:strand:+ start:1776 stop:2201 length:426 start_codon:yes stop_codon:yes gene_type:complete
MKKIIFKHKKTDDLVIKKGEDFFLMKDNCISETIMPSKIITDGSDWECITNNVRDSYELLLDENKNIYFKSFFTGQEYHIGDKFTIKENHSFSDGRRNFTIGSFYISDSKESKNGNSFQFVYAHDKDDDKGIHLNGVVLLN